MRRFAASGLLIFLLAVGSAVAQDFHLYGFSMYDYEFLGAGARARGMGGAFVGLANDASALTWNPAGLIQVTKTQSSVAGSVYRFKTKNDRTYQSWPQQDFLDELTKDRLNLDYGSFVAPIRIRGHLFVTSAAYQRIQDNSDESLEREVLNYRFSPAGTQYVASDVAEARFTTNANSHVDKFSIGFGSAVYGRLSGGLAANIYSGSGRNEYHRGFLDTTEMYFVGQFIDSIEYARVTRNEDLTSINGFNFSGGLLYQAEKLQFGVNIQTPFEMVTDHDVKRADTIYYKNVYSPGQGTPVATRPTLYRAKTKIEQPLVIGFGLAVKPTPKLTLAGDFELRSTDGAKYFVRSEQPPVNVNDSTNLFTLPTNIYYVDTTETSYYDAKGDLVEIYNEFDIGLKSSYQFRLGAEYLVATSLGTIPLRGGFRLTKQPYRDVSTIWRNVDNQVAEGFVLGDNISQTSFSFGSGIHWTQVHLDVAFELSEQEQVEQGFDLRDLTQLEYEQTKTKTSPRFFFNFTGFF